MRLKFKNEDREYSDILEANQAAQMLVMELTLLE